MMRVAVAIFYWVAALFLILLTWRAEVTAERKSLKHAGKAPLIHKTK
jgi:hypothetical protein